MENNNDNKKIDYKTPGIKTSSLPINIPLKNKNEDPDNVVGLFSSSVVQKIEFNNSSIQEDSNVYDSINSSTMMSICPYNGNWPITSNDDVNKRDRSTVSKGPATDKLKKPKRVDFSAIEPLNFTLDGDQGYEEEDELDGIPLVEEIELNPDCVVSQHFEELHKSIISDQ